MSKFGNIYLSWRKGSGSKRHIVGIIKYNSTKGATFQYLPDKELKDAIDDGFKCYTEFPELDKLYKDNVLDTFKQRLFRSERSDYKGFLDFWGIHIENKDDILYLLAHTQGLVPTDNFEFLADFKVTKDLRFVSEIAGLTYTKVPAPKLNVGDEIIWKRNPTEYDKFQVDLFTNDGISLGHVKKVHSRVFFHSRGDDLKIKVQAIDKNGTIKRAFILINK